MRFFNTAGPIKPDKHYCIPPLVIFDRREDRRWRDKIFRDRRASDGGVEIEVWEM